jgi:hypothetical protein
VRRAPSSVLDLFLGRDSLLGKIDTEILRMVIELVRERTGAQRWRFVQVLPYPCVYVRHRAFALAVCEVF